MGARTLLASLLVIGAAAAFELRPLPITTALRSSGVRLDVPATVGDLGLTTIAELPRSENSFAIAAAAVGHAPLVVFLHSFPPPQFHARTWILERGLGEVYTVVESLPVLSTRALLDLDGDQHLDLMGQVGNYLRVYEAETPAGVPSQLVWQSPPLPNVEGRPTVWDTDCDGHLEILHSVNSLGGLSQLRIYEHTADNTYTEVFNDVVGLGDMGDKPIADLDGDGRPEIVLCGLDGDIYIYESPSNNVWRKTWSFATTLVNAYGVQSGHDLDGNGKPEFYVTGNDHQTFGVETWVFEPVADNQYVEVAELIYPHFAGSGNGTGIAELDGLPGEEFVMIAGDRVTIWHAKSIGQWGIVGELARPPGQLNDLGFEDMNKNGRAEMFWAGLTTLVLEAPAIPVDADPASSRLPQVVLYPNPSHGVSWLALPHQDALGFDLRVYDVAGRLVTEWRTLPAPNIRLPVAHLRSGRYVVEVRNRAGRRIGQAPLTIVH